MANVLANPDFTMLEPGFGSHEPLYWITNVSWEPSFFLGGFYGVNVIGPGVLRVDLGPATQVDPLVAYPGVGYSGPGFDASPGDVWHITFDFCYRGVGALSSDPNLSGPSTPDHNIFVRVCGVFLDLLEDRYEVFYMNLPRMDMGSGAGNLGVNHTYDEQFQIPQDWPAGQYQFAICNPGHSIADGHYGLRFDIKNPVLELDSGSAPPGSGPPITGDEWVFVAAGADFPGNHPDYAFLAENGIEGVLWLDTDPNIVAGMASTRAAGLKAGVWLVAGNTEPALTYAARASTDVTTFGPDLLVMDNEFVAKGYDPSPGWTWNEDVMAAYRALQPTQATAVTMLPLQDDFNYAAYTSRGVGIWPQSYGATIGPDDLDPITVIDRVVSNGVSASVIKAVLPYDVWAADVTELRQHGIYTFAVFTAEGMQAAGGGTPPPVPPPGINGLDGVPSAFAQYPRPHLASGSPYPPLPPVGADVPATGDQVDIEWDAWIFADPFPNGNSTIGSLPHTGSTSSITPGMRQQSIFWEDCRSGLFYEPGVGVALLTPPGAGGQQSRTCGPHFFAITASEYVIVPNREYLGSGFFGPEWHRMVEYYIGLCHSTALVRLTSNARRPSYPDDELRGGAFRYDIQPFAPLFVTNFLSPEAASPPCGSNLFDFSTIVGGPHDGFYDWKISVQSLNGAAGDGCERFQVRLLNPPGGGIEGEIFHWDGSWIDVSLSGATGVFSGDHLYIPPSPGRCYVVQVREVCGGIIGPAISCSVCLGEQGVKLDLEFRAEAGTASDLAIDDTSSTVHLSTKSGFRAG